MFTREDYDDYFSQIARIERKMIYRSHELAQKIDDEPLRRILAKIGDDEVRHYGYVLKMIEGTMESSHSESRREVREHHLAMIRMRAVGGKEKREIAAYAVNFSKRGACLECGELLESGGIWDLEIRSLKTEAAIFRRGRVVWSREVEKDFFISGLEL
jgi:hypothetical protein